MLRKTKRRIKLNRLRVILYYLLGCLAVGLITHVSIKQIESLGEFNIMTTSLFILYSLMIIVPFILLSIIIGHAVDVLDEQRKELRELDEKEHRKDVYM